MINSPEKRKMSPADKRFYFGLVPFAVLAEVGINLLLISKGLYGFAALFDGAQIYAGLMSRIHQRD